MTPNTGPDRNVVMLCDFDGTITEQDVGMELLRQFSSTDWERIEEPFNRGEVSILENMRAQFEHVREDAPELVEYAHSIITIRPGWEAFVRYCEESSLELAVLSGGLDFYIQALLPVTTPMPDVHSLLSEYTDAGWKIDLPWANPTEEESSGFKEAVVDRYREEGKHIWFVGNGSSDWGAATVADRVWAVEPLLSYCREHGIPATSFETFYDVTDDLKQLLSGAAV